MHKYIYIYIYIFIWISYIRVIISWTTIHFDTSTVPVSLKRRCLNRRVVWSYFIDFRRSVWNGTRCREIEWISRLNDISDGINVFVIINWRLFSSRKSSQKSDLGHHITSSWFHWLLRVQIRQNDRGNASRTSSSSISHLQFSDLRSKISIVFFTYSILARILHYKTRRKYLNRKNDNCIFWDSRSESCFPHSNITVEMIIDESSSVLRKSRE